MKEVNVIAPAKLNLSLDVVGVDSKGYHLLDMVMQSVSVFERLTLVQQDTISITSNAKFIPTDEKNTAVKAAMNFFEYTKLKGGVHIHVRKAVPIKAGMAGGSADAAGVIVGLDHMYGTKLTMEQMCEIGIVTGSDVPFMLRGGTKRVKGTGEIILPAPPMPPCYFVICMPAKGVSTPQAFAAYDTLGEKVKVDTDSLMGAIKHKKLTDIAKYMANDLEKAAGSPDTQPIKEKLLELGALGSLMTGSGSAVFGLFDDEKKAEAAVMYFRGQVKSAFLARPVNFGASVRKDKK
ncbi:MAG: 4-(cytidine 5'-diphospho)-2-C-methyl-D-erythritol kinase [Oscillospiraceae bacterium]